MSVSCLGARDQRDDGVFDRSVSMFDNDVSNASALFELSDGGVMRIDEMRRVGYPTPLHESRFRFFGTDASFEQLARVSVWQDAQDSHDVSELLATEEMRSPDDPTLAHVALELRAGFSSGHASVHDVARLPRELDGAVDGHEESHHFLADDVVTAVNTGTLPPVDAWTAARFTLPGIAAHASMRRNGERVPVLDLGDAPGA